MDPPEMDDDRAYEAWKAPTWRQLLGKHCPEVTTVIANPHEKGALIYVASAAEVRKAIKAAKIKFDRALVPGDFDPAENDDAGGSTAGAPDPAALARERARREAEECRLEQEKAFRTALLSAIAAKWKGPLKRDDLYAIADQLIGGSWEAKAIGDAFYGGKLPNVGGMSEAELTKLLIIVTSRHEIEARHGKPGRLLALAKRVGVDATKLRKSTEPAASPAAKKKSKK